MNIPSYPLEIYHQFAENIRRPVNKYMQLYRTKANVLKSNCL